MKPIFNLIVDVVDRYLLNVPDDKKEEYKEVGVEVIKAIAEGTAKGATVSLKEKLK